MLTSMSSTRFKRNLVLISCMVTISANLFGKAENLRLSVAVSIAFSGVLKSWATEAK